MHITGQCHCGEIAYEAEIDPERVSICHCTDCQQLTGSAYRVTAFTLNEDFSLIRGAPKAYVKYGESGAPSTQYFCANCGSPLYRMGKDKASVGIRVGSIDQRRELSPKRQVWCRSALPWSGDIEALPGIDRDS